jgi:hypothetical protein
VTMDDFLRAVEKVLKKDIRGAPEVKGVMFV